MLYIVVLKVCYKSANLLEEGVFVMNENSDIVCQKSNGVQN